MSEQYLMMNEAQNEPDVEAASALRRETFSVERPQSEPGTVSAKKTPTKGGCRCSSTEFLGTFSCCSVCSTCIILFVAVVLVANVVSGLLGSMKVLSVTKYDSTEFFSLTKTVYSVGGAKQEKWSLKIPENLLNTTFVISDAIAEGDGSLFVGGMPGLAYSGIPLYFALDKDRTMIHVYEKQLKSRATNAEDHTLLEHGATDTWLTSGPIASDDSATGTITVDITQLLKLNFLIPFRTWTGVVAGPRLSRVVDAACYPRNCRFRLEIQTSVGVTIETYLALSLLPKVPMTARQADKRIGYFETEFTDIGVHTSKSTANDNGENGEDYEVDKKYHLIHKWNLKKSTDCDDTTKLCTPTKEIIYHIDPTIPKRWRSYMKRAVELWQPSFEALGYANTPRARLPEDADWPNDYDSGDIRYSSIRMGLMQNGATAIGPATIDPRTGEIMDADISFPESWVSVFAGKYWPEMTTLGLKKQQSAADSSSSLRTHSHEHRHHRNHRHHGGCGNAYFRAHAATTSHMMRILAADQEDGQVPLNIIGEGLIAVAVHEIGHTLGLRHNFKGSTGIPYPSIYKSEYTDKFSSTTSVMDYTAAVIAPTRAQQDHATVFPKSKTVGAYDRLAIAYGYTWFDDETSDTMHPGVRAIADSLAATGLEFATDEDAPGGLDTDQLNNRYDLTDDPVSWIRDQFLVSQRMMRNSAVALSWTGDKVGYEAQGNYILSALDLSAKRLGTLIHLLGGKTLNKQFVSNKLTQPPSSTQPALVRVVSSDYQNYLLDVLLSFVTDSHYRDFARNTQELSSDNYFYSTKQSSLRQMYNMVIEYYVIDAIVNKEKLNKIAHNHYVESAGGPVWNPPSWKPPPTAAKELLGSYSVMKRLGDALFGFADSSTEEEGVAEGTTQSWKDTKEWPLQKAYANQLVQVFNETKSLPMMVEVHADVGRVMDDLCSSIQDLLNNSVSEMTLTTKRYLEDIDAMLKK